MKLKQLINQHILNISDVELISTITKLPISRLERVNIFFIQKLWMERIIKKVFNLKKNVLGIALNTNNILVFIHPLDIFVPELLCHEFTHIEQVIRSKLNFIDFKLTYKDIYEDSLEAEALAKEKLFKMRKNKLVSCVCTENNQKGVKLQ